MNYTFPAYRRHHSRKSRIPPTMKEDQHGLLLDTGAIVNVHSDLWRKRFEHTLKKRKLKIKDVRKLATFSGISGKPCTSKTQCHIPINVAGSIGNFKSQELPNSQCPAILGLNGLEGNKIMLIPHDDRVIIPNGGQVKITVSKEVQIVKCLRTPSGHLLLPCDEWTKKSSGRDTPLCLFQGVVTP